MTREELFALRRQSKWERLCRLQERVMPIVYGIGESFVVNEVDIRPDDGLVYVFGEFCDCEVWIRLERPICGLPVVPWLEIKIMDNPENVPDSCPAPLKELEEEAGVELFFRRSWLSLGTEARDCSDSAALKIVFEHLLVTAARAKQIVCDGREDALPFDPKGVTSGARTRGASLVN